MNSTLGINLRFTGTESEWHFQRKLACCFSEITVSLFVLKNCDFKVGKEGVSLLFLICKVFENLESLISEIWTGMSLVSQCASNRKCQRCL